MFWFLLFGTLGLLFCLLTKAFALSFKVIGAIFSFFLTVGLIIATLTSTVVLFIPAIFLLLIGFIIGKIIK